MDDDENDENDDEKPRQPSGGSRSSVLISAVSAEISSRPLCAGRAAVRGFGFR